LERTDARRSRRESELQRKERRARLLRVRTFGDGHVRRPPGCREKLAENRGRGAVHALTRSARRSCSVPASGSPRMRAELPTASIGWCSTTGSEATAIGHYRHYSARVVGRRDRCHARPRQREAGDAHRRSIRHGLYPDGAVELDRVRAKPCGNMRQGQGSLLQSLALGRRHGCA
jgi:hypothetical protein